jgi:hypothetical protein
MDLQGSVGNDIPPRLRRGGMSFPTEQVAPAEVERTTTFRDRSLAVIWRRMFHNHKEQNDVFQNTLHSKGNQTLAVFRMADPSDKNSVVVIASLSTR